MNSFLPNTRPRPPSPYPPTHESTVYKQGVAVVPGPQHNGPTVTCSDMHTHQPGGTHAFHGLRQGQEFIQGVLRKRHDVLKTNVEMTSHKREPTAAVCSSGGWRTFDATASSSAPSCWSRYMRTHSQSSKRRAMWRRCMELLQRGSTLRTPNAGSARWTKSPTRTREWPRGAAHGCSVCHGTRQAHGSAASCACKREAAGGAALRLLDRSHAVRDERQPPAPFHAGDTPHLRTYDLQFFQRLPVDFLYLRQVRSASPLATTGAPCSCHQRRGHQR